MSFLEPTSTKKMSWATEDPPSYENLDPKEEPLLHELPAEVRSHVLLFLSSNDKLVARTINRASKVHYDTFHVLEEVEELVRIIAPRSHLICSTPQLEAASAISRSKPAEGSTPTTRHGQGGGKGGILLLPEIPFHREVALVTQLMFATEETQKEACHVFLTGFVREHSIVLLRKSNIFLGNFLTPRSVVGEGGVKRRLGVQSEEWRHIKLDTTSTLAAAAGAGSNVEEWRDELGENCGVPQKDRKLLEEMIAAAYNIFSLQDQEATQTTLWMAHESWIENLDTQKKYLWMRERIDYMLLTAPMYALDVASGRLQEVREKPARNGGRWNLSKTAPEENATEKFQDDDAVKPFPGLLCVSYQSFRGSMLFGGSSKVDSLFRLVYPYRAVMQTMDSAQKIVIEKSAQ